MHYIIFITSLLLLSACISNNKPHPASATEVLTPKKKLNKIQWPVAIATHIPNVLNQYPEDPLYRAREKELTKEIREMKPRDVPQNEEEAVIMYRKAAEQGNAIGQFQLGEMYQMGTGIKQDFEEAVKWYKKSAERGNAIGQYHLGDMYRMGKGIKQDFEEAVKWYKKSAAQGNADGQTNLGFMYLYGHGITQDQAQAIKWYKKSAEQGNANAQWHLAYTYQHGTEGVKKDYKEAFKWYKKVAAQKNSDPLIQEDAQKQIERLEEEYSLQAIIKREDNIKRGKKDYYQIFNNGTIFDKNTGLMWMRCSLGQTYKNNHCVDEGSMYYTRNQIKQMIEESKESNFAGYSDWRLPTIDELASLVYCSESVRGFGIKGVIECSNFSTVPAINLVAFPDTKPTTYMSKNSRWSVDFHEGGDSGSAGVQVRLVRGMNEGIPLVSSR